MKAAAAVPFRRRLKRLDNGLRVATVSLPHLHSASVVMYAKVGSRYESARDNGLSHFLEHMLFRGTAALPDAYLLNHAIEALGGTLYAETGRDYSLYQIRLHPDSLADGIALFGDIFHSPQFSDIDIERRIILEEMLEDLDERGRLINIDDIARKAVWPRHPLGYRITGPYRNVERFTVADVRRHFAKHYGARNMVLCVSGPVDERAVHHAVARAMSALPPGREHALVPPTDSQRRARFVTARSDGSQTSVQLIFRGWSELTPAYPSLLALARIIDDGMSTRLHRRLLDELGLAYYVSGNLEPFVDTGLYEIDATCGHANVAALVRESLALLARLRDEPPSEEELHKARRRYRWDLESSFDDPDAMAGWWGGTELFYPPATFAEKIARLQRVTPRSVQAAAQSVFRRERMTVACVGAPSRRTLDEVRRVVADFV